MKVAALLRDRPAMAWAAMVVVVYVVATLAFITVDHPRIDSAMRVAISIAHGRLDIPMPPGSNDTATVAGRTYLIVNPLPVVPYLVFAKVSALWQASRWVVSAFLGIVAAWLMLPLARRYGPAGRPTYWLAALGAFGTLLFPLAIRGDFYYLAHVEAVLLSTVALIEWAGRRRPWLIGLALGLAALARPTLFVAALVFGVAIVLHDQRRRLRAGISFALPVALAIAVTGVYDALRFGSPIETGYAMSTLSNPALTEARAFGLFSTRNVLPTLARLVARGFDLRDRFPYLVPDPYGHSMLLTSPALLAAVGASVRDRATRVLWSTALLVTIPLLLYYGGAGWVTYGNRYFMDVVPFLLALTALAARRRFGALERSLIVLSIAFCGYGVIWAVFQ